MYIDKSYLFDYIRQLYALYSFSPKTGCIKMPMRYILELTYRCNLRCPFCYISDKTSKNELSKDEWFNIIDQIPAFSLISFVAGEVLLKENFIDIYKKASEKFRKITVISNGIMLNKEITDAFIKKKLLLLSISLDGYERNHDKYRNCNGLWDKINLNIDNFNVQWRNKQLPMLDIKTCILKENLDDIPQLYKHAMKIKAQFFSLTFIRTQQLRQSSHLYETFSPEFYQSEYPIKKYFDMEHFKEIYKELESLSKKSKVILRYAPRFQPRGDLEKIERFFNYKNKSINQIYKPCQIPFTSIYITPQGDIYPCLSYKVGNIKDIPLKEVINTVKFKCFRKNLYVSKIFNACQMCCDAIPK